MPVLVTGAEEALGRACAHALLCAGGEVRVFLDPGGDPLVLARLRAVGAKAARGALDDEGRLELALEQVHTVVHAATDPLVTADELLDDTATVLSAALGAGCRRVVLLSHLGADDPRDNPWLEALGEAEALLADAPIETVILRRALTYGRGDRLTEAVAEGAPGASVEALHVPLWLDDLAAAVVAADARHRAAATVPHLLVPLGGPDTVSIGELIALLGGQVTGGAAGGIARADPSRAWLPPHVLDLLSRDLLPPRGSPAAGTPLRTGAAQVRAAASAPS